MSRPYRQARRRCNATTRTILNRRDAERFKNKIGLTFDMTGMHRLAGACPLDGRVRRRCVEAEALSTPRGLRVRVCCGGMRATFREVSDAGASGDIRK